LFLEKIRDSLIIGKGQKTSRKSLSKGQLPIVKITKDTQKIWLINFWLPTVSI